MHHLFQNLKHPIMPEVAVCQSSFSEYSVLQMFLGQGHMVRKVACWTWLLRAFKNISQNSSPCSFWCQMPYLYL